MAWLSRVISVRKGVVKGFYRSGLLPYRADGRPSFRDFYLPSVSSYIPPIVTPVPPPSTLKQHIWSFRIGEIQYSMAYEIDGKQTSMASNMDTN